MKIKAFCCIALVMASVIVISLATVPEVASAYTPTEEDVEYLEWQLETLDSVIIYSDLMLSEEYDLDVMELWAGKGYDFCKKALIEIDQFDVSSEMEPSKREFKLYLQDRKQAFYYYERGAKYLDVDDIDTGVSYSESAVEHLTKSTDLLPEITLPSPTPEAISTPEVTPSPTPEETPTPVVTPTPPPQLEKDSDGDGVPDEYDYAPSDPNVQTKEDVETPGFGAIFAIGSLLAVAYLVLRRRR